jgi:nucleoside-triphosphatase THEP1
MNGEAQARWFPDENARGAIVLVSGTRRAGKTTLLLEARRAAQAANLSVGGMLSIARFEDGEKVGIDVMDAGSGARVPLATVTAEPRGPIHTGHYTFDPAGMAAGLEFARAGCAADLFIVDELGPLELVRGEGWAPALPLIRARQFGAALVVVRPELLDAARAALDLPADAPVVEVTPDNRVRQSARLNEWIAARGRG